MDDFDEYIFDEIVFDEKTLAKLDQEEKKHQVQVQKPIPTVTAARRVEPPPKRQRTHGAWTSGGSSAATSRTTEEDLPEISLQGDGSYGIGHRLHRPPISNAPVQRREDNPPLNSARKPNTYNVRPPAVRVHTTPAPSISHPHPNVTRLHNSRAPNNQGLSSMQAPVSSPAQLSLQLQVEALQKKLEELSQDHSKIQASLKTENDKRLAKEGEVAILRKSMEKTAQNHAAQIALLRTEKETVDAKQAQMQKDMKDEMERLRTQFLFRQQELEMANRKAPGSVRPKKPIRDFPSTPVPLPSAMSGWNNNAATSSRVRIDETPLKPSRPPPTLKASPTKQTRKSPEKARKSFALPGFENAFETSTPIRSPSKRVDKGKGKLIQTNDLDIQPSQIFRPISQISQGHTQPRFGNAPPMQNDLDAFSEPFSSGKLDSSQIKDEDMDMNPPESDEDVYLEEPVTINWKSELCRIILTYICPPDGQTVFQQLITAAPSSSSTDIYSSSCMRIMEVVANSAKSDDYEDSIRIVSESLVLLFSELSGTNQLLSLSVLFNLFSQLIKSLPNFSSAVLSCHIHTNDHTPISLIDLISKVILKHWEANSKPDWDTFAAEIVLLLQTLCFYQQDDTRAEIERFIRNHENLLMLLNTSGRPWLMERTTCLLMLLSSHHNTYKAFLKLSPEDEVTTDTPRFLLTERLCSILMDTTTSPTDNAKIYILMYFGQLSMAHLDAHNTLGASPVLIPSLILYISHLATPLWEDDGTLASSAENTASYILALNQTLFLLYQLIFAVEPTINLIYKLQHASARQFNSIKNIFLVTFGRMSYCECPSWIESNQRPELEYLAEVSREILELMVDGPEGDSVWAAFQTEPDEEGGVDEGEIEAQFIS